MKGRMLLCPLCREDLVDVRIDWEKLTDSISVMCRECRLYVKMEKEK